MSDISALPASPSVPTGAESKTVADILTAAADLIEPEGRWTQGTWARTADGRGDARPGTACSWCLYGAILEAGRGCDSDDTEDALQTVMDVVGKHPISWNDSFTRTQAEVVAALRAAAEKARTATADKPVGTSASECTH